jgi:hypothetical protein
MAPHDKELTTEQKEIILNLWNEVFSSYAMQSMTGINSRTIKKYLRRMRERGNIENLPRRGGIRKTILRDDTILFRSVKTNRRQIRVITKLPNSEQSSKGKVKTHASNISWLFYCWCLSYFALHSSKKLHLTNLELFLSAWWLVPYRAVPLLLSRRLFVYLRGIIKLWTTAGGFNYEFWLSLCKIVRSSVILLLPLFNSYSYTFYV